MSDGAKILGVLVYSKHITLLTLSFRGRPGMNIKISQRGVCGSQTHLSALFNWQTRLTAVCLCVNKRVPTRYERSSPTNDSGIFQLKVQRWQPFFKKTTTQCRYFTASFYQLFPTRSPHSSPVKMKSKTVIGPLQNSSHPITLKTSLCFSSVLHHLRTPWTSQKL